MFKACICLFGIVDDLQPILNKLETDTLFALIPPDEDEENRILSSFQVFVNS